MVMIKLRFLQIKSNEVSHIVKVTPVLKNVEGINILTKDNIDDHFRQLTNMWNKV